MAEVSQRWHSVVSLVPCIVVGALVNKSVYKYDSLQEERSSELSMDLRGVPRPASSI